LFFGGRSNFGLT